MWASLDEYLHIVTHHVCNSVAMAAKHAHLFARFYIDDDNAEVIERDRQHATTEQPI